MSTLITRLFANENTASQASEALVSDGFHKSSVRIIGGSESAAREAMAAMGVDDAAADVYAGRIAGGNALVAMRAPFGMSGGAMATLEKFESIEVDMPQESHISYQSDPDLEPPKIIPGNKKFLTAEGSVGTSTSFSEFFGMRLLSRKQGGSAKVRTSTMTGNTLSDKQGGKARVSSWTITSNLLKKPGKGKSIIRNPTPFSSALGWPTLTEKDEVL